MSSQPESALSAASESPSLIHEVVPGPELLDAAATTLRMLAEPTRLHLLWQLTQGPRTVSELTAAAEVPRTVVSQHLAKLRHGGLVTTRKDGRHVIYSLRDGHLLRLIRETINHADHHITGEPTHD